MLPEFFYDQDRLLHANAHLTDFNENAHCNTSYKDLLKDLNKKRTAKQELYNKDTIINLPFQVEESELERKLLIFENDDAELTIACGKVHQAFAILSIEIPSIEKEKTPMKQGGARIITK